jgi:hypothetical protein
MRSARYPDAISWKLPFIDPHSPLAVHPAGFFSLAVLLEIPPHSMHAPRATSAQRALSWRAILVEFLFLFVPHSPLACISGLFFAPSRAIVVLASCDLTDKLGVANLA